MTVLCNQWDKWSFSRIIKPRCEHHPGLHLSRTHTKSDVEHLPPAPCPAHLKQEQQRHVWFNNSKHIIWFQVSVMTACKYHQIKTWFDWEWVQFLQMVRKTPRGPDGWLGDLFAFFLLFLQDCILHSKTHFDELGQSLRQQAQHEKHIMTTADFPPN